jgi:hypothetical protein
VKLKATQGVSPCNDVEEDSTYITVVDPPTVDINGPGSGSVCGEQEKTFQYTFSPSTATVTASANNSVNCGQGKTRCRVQSLTSHVTESLKGALLQLGHYLTGAACDVSALPTTYLQPRLLSCLQLVADHAVMGIPLCSHVIERETERERERDREFQDVLLKSLRAPCLAHIEL